MEQSGGLISVMGTLHQGNTLKISEGSLFTILDESLGMRKLFSKWVPRLLTLDQKQQRIKYSKHCLELLRRGKKNILCRYVSIDETWIHHYTPKTKRSSAEWTHELVKVVQSDQKLNCGLVRFWYPYFGTRMIFCLSTILRKVKPSTATITWHYWINWAQKPRKNGLTCKIKKSCSTKTMHRATNPWKRWSNRMN